MKKALSLTGLFIGLAFVIVGICSISGEFSGVISYPSYAPYGYDSGFATFGADYYTYSVNNTAEAAYGARSAAYNIANVANYLLKFCGISSILFGLMIICGFGIVLYSCFKKDTQDIVSSPNNIVEEIDATNNISVE